MGELTPSERLQPSLLDRLTDEEPHTQRESRSQRVLSIEKLREFVKRDLIGLLNTSNLEPSADLSDYPEIKTSVLNYGIPDLCGKTAKSVDVTDLARAIKQAIWDFEPRIVRRTLRVTGETIKSRNAVTFEIEGELWAEPVPVHLFLRTEIDLENGMVIEREGER
jgi:type VI secretion system protein ImpF